VKRQFLTRCAALIFAVSLASFALPAVSSAQLSYDTGPAGPRAAAPRPADTGYVSGTPAENYMGITGGERYDISFRQASLREVLQFLSWISGLNIIIPEGLEGIVNVSFKDISISDALGSIIKVNDLEYTMEGRIVRVGKSDAFRESGEDLKTQTFRLRYAPATDMANKSKTLLSGRGSAIADERTNSLVVRDLPANLDNVQRFVDDVDIKDAQVLIESKILEATRQFSRAMGIQWGATKTGGKWQLGGLEAVGELDNGRYMNANLSPNIATPTSGLAIGSLFKGVNLDIQLMAAEERGDVFVISDPSIVTSNGRPANIRSGAKFYVVGSGTVNIGSTTGTSTGTTTGTTAGTGLQEIKTGIELKVVPQITVHDFVKLDIEAITSTPDFSRAVQGIPMVLDNTARTVVLVKDGETTVIGGLSRFSNALTNKRVPYFSKIPIFGNLFKSKERNADNTDLLVFIKPTIIRVEGQIPAQMRVREVEELQEELYLEPSPEMRKDKEKKGIEKEKARSRKGNKYVK